MRLLPRCGKLIAYHSYPWFEVKVTPCTRLRWHLGRCDSKGLLVSMR